MALWLKDPSSPPEEAFQYPAIAGPNLRSFTFHNLYLAVHQHYATNLKTPPSKEDVLKWVCENQAVNCYDGREVFRNAYTDPPSYISRGLKSPEWPLVLRPFKLFAKDGDKGLGSIIERVIGPIGGSAYKDWHQKIFGKPCSCTERRDRLDEDFPL